MRSPVLAVLLFCALAPVIVAATKPLRESPSSGLAWPVWELAGQRIDPAEVGAAAMFCGAAWMLERHMWRDPASRIFWLVWLPLFGSGMALVLMGNLIAGFSAIVGFALMGKAYDWKRHRKFARRVRTLREP